MYKIYKIVCFCGCDKLYIGGTKQPLKKRFSQHRCNAKINTKSKLYDHMRDVGTDSFEIVFIAEFKFITIEQAKAEEHKFIVEHNSVRDGYNGRYESQICKHGTRRYVCRDCEGSAICEHSKYKTKCARCKTSDDVPYEPKKRGRKSMGLCEHNRRRYLCRACKGGGVCEHDKLRRCCRLCKGSSICEHDRQKYHCRDCLDQKFFIAMFETDY